MKTSKKIAVAVISVILAVAVSVCLIFAYTRQNSNVPTIEITDEYLATEAAEGQSTTELSEDDWPFANSQEGAEFEVKSTTLKSGETSSDSDSDSSSDSSSSSAQKQYLENIFSKASSKSDGHPVLAESSSTNTEYQKFAVGDFNGDGKNEMIVYAETYQNDSYQMHYYSSYFIIDSSGKTTRVTRTTQTYNDPVFYTNGVFKIGDEYGFLTDAGAKAYGITDSNSVLGYDTSESPYLRYTTTGAYLDTPTEISESSYKSEVAKLTSGTKVSVTMVDLTEANVSNLK